MDTKKLIIVDDHQLISAGLRALLRELKYKVEITECNSGREALRLLDEYSSYDLLLIDINMPSFNGFDLLAGIKARNINTPAAMISASSDIPEVQNAIDSGAIGFVPKNCPPSLMLSGIDQLLQGQRFIPPHLENYIQFDRSKRQKETDRNLIMEQAEDAKTGIRERELEVLKLLKVGKSNKDIATILDISPSTVKFHIAKLFKKLNARSRTECVSVATNRNLLNN